MKTPAELFAGRRRKEPVRDTQVYARLQNIGGWQAMDKRPLIKPTPANLRMFGKTPYARRAIKRIKDPIASLAWEVAPKPGIKLNTTLKQQIEIAHSCLSQPNYDDSFRSFIEQIIEDMMINGAGTYEHQVGGDATRPLWAWPVDSMSIQINAGWDGSDTQPRYYQTLGYGNFGGIQGKPLRNDELVYIRVDPTTENPFGLGPLEVAFAAINRKLGVSDYAGKLASNAQPENLLVFEGMTAASLQALRNYWRNEVEGQGQTPIMATPLGSESAVLKLRGTDDSSVFLGYQELLIREIATAFALNPMCLGIAGDVNRSTAEIVDDMDWDNAVVPNATLISHYITRETIEQKLGFSQLEHRFLGLKRDDKKAEAEIFKLEYESNAATPNEYRERNNMPPMDNAWGDRTFADMKIAIDAARGAAIVDDPDLQTADGAKKPDPSAPKPKPTKRK